MSTAGPLATSPIRAVVPFVSALVECPCFYVSVPSYRVNYFTMAAEFSLSVVVFVLAAALPTLAMDCTFGDGNAIEKIANSCPRPILDSSDKKFCCFDSKGEFYCCEGGTFALYVLVGLIVLLIPLSVLCCLICCLWRCIRPRCQ